jgi:2-haloacid dehalogenase
VLTFQTPPKVVTFDCYGTLVEWDAVLVPAIHSVLRLHDCVDISPETVLAEFHRLSFEAQDTPPYRSYVEIVRECFHQAFLTAGLQVAPETSWGMVRALQEAKPHEDVIPTLTLLKRHCKIGIITNSDGDLIAPCIQRLGVPVDFLVTAEMAMAYKPSAQIFGLADRMIGFPRADVVHVAMSMDLDIAACVSRRQRCVWINRRRIGGQPPHQANAVLNDLSLLPQLLGFQ